MAVGACLEDLLGPHGIPRAALARTCGALTRPLADLRSDIAAGRLPALSVARDVADIETAERALAKLSAGARTLVFFGTGGSGLGGQTVAQFGGWNIPGHADPDTRSRPRTRFYDNLDPDSLTKALGSLDLGSTRFIVTSKSGGTPETLVQAMAAIQSLQAAGLAARIGDLVLGITEPAVAGRSNGLRSLLTSFGCTVLDHHPGIGGRYSVLSNVGMTPALARGLDVRAIRAGAAGVLDQLDRTPDPMAFAPAVGAALSVAGLRERGLAVHVMMPYADRLRQIGPWFGQLWAESLGKGGCGTTPVACLGPLDQHSQLQLFMDGPRNALITVIRIATAGTGVRIDPALAAIAGFDMMAVRTVGDLVAAQTYAVPDALAKAGRPVRTFDLERLDEATLGATLMHFMIETILAGRLFGIDPFDQPAVELAKILTRERLLSGA
jgi:glucose-6-phosphate isomerase